MSFCYELWGGGGSETDFLSESRLVTCRLSIVQTVSVVLFVVTPFRSTLFGGYYEKIELDYFE